MDKQKKYCNRDSHIEGGKGNTLPQMLNETIIEREKIHIYIYLVISSRRPLLLNKFLATILYISNLD
jgi:hypothetical protein